VLDGWKKVSRGDINIVANKNDIGAILVGFPGREVVLVTFSLLWFGS